MLVGHHRHVVQAVEVGQGLQIGLVLDQLLGAPVQETDVGVGADDLLPAELENKTQDAMGGGMLGTEVDGVVADLAVCDAALARGLDGAFGGLQALHAVRVGGMGEVGVDGLERRSLGDVSAVRDVSGDLAGRPQRRAREGAYVGSCEGQAPGAAACDAVERRHLRCVQVNWAGDGGRLISSSSSGWRRTGELPTTEAGLERGTTG